MDFDLAARFVGRAMKELYSKDYNKDLNSQAINKSSTINEIVSIL
jgi:hypothetical protein